MSELPDQQLAEADIIRLGVEAGAGVLAMSEHPTNEEQEALKEKLGYRAIELAYSQDGMPEGIEAE